MSTTPAITLCLLAIVQALSGSASLRIIRLIVALTVRCTVHVYFAFAIVFSRLFSLCSSHALSLNHNIFCSITSCMRLLYLLLYDIFALMFV